MIADPNKTKVAEVARVMLPHPAVLQLAWRYIGPSIGATVRVWVGIGRVALPIDYFAPPPSQLLSIPARELRVELVVDPGTPTQHRLSAWAAPYCI